MMDMRYREALTNIEKHQGRYEVLRMTSAQAVWMFDNESLDFVYIDANHDYAHASEDINNWWSIVREGGVLAGHDYANIKRGHIIKGSNIVCSEDFKVKKAVNEFAKLNNLKVHITTNDFWFKEPFQSWWIEKR
jgi:predicted O-methyltransferase YrrM